jgi:hypothetical protein
MRGPPSDQRPKLVLAERPVEGAAQEPVVAPLHDGRRGVDDADRGPAVYVARPPGPAVTPLCLRQPGEPP